MSRVFMISDLHFGHVNLIKNLRGMNPDEHDQMIIENWNRVVNKRDLVYLLGDIAMEKVDPVIKNLPKLAGRKVIILGNHDKLGVVNTLKSMNIDVLGCTRYKGFVLTHIPIHPIEVVRFRGNIHGHVHENSYDDPRYYNVSCDVIGFTPKLFTEIEDEFASRKLTYTELTED